MMAEKPVLNKAAINAATAKKAAATAKATAAKAIGEPIAKKVLPTIPKTAAALNALAKAMQGNDKKAIAKAQADAKAAIAANKSSATKEELALAYLGEAEGISIPEAEYASEESRSAYDLLTLELTNMGLSSLIKPLRDLFERGITDGDTLRLELSQAPEYKARFSANETRLKQGLRALSPAEYIKMEDQYQEIMRNYGLPESYYSKDSTGKQAGFDTLLGNDVSAVELEDRMMVAQNRVLKANPEVLSSLKAFYGDTITNGDILAYTLNPEKGLEDIKRKVTAAEISGAAQAAGLNKITKETSLEKITGMRTRAEELAAAGVTKETAQQQYGTIAELADRGGMLSDIYKTSPYGQTQAEAEIFNVAGQTEAARQRKKLTALETAAFSGQAGVGALARDRAGVL
jgi:hypothetical protein